MGAPSNPRTNTDTTREDTHSLPVNDCRTKESNKNDHRSTAAGNCVSGKDILLAVLSVTVVVITCYLMISDMANVNLWEQVTQMRNELTEVKAKCQRQDAAMRNQMTSLSRRARRSVTSVTASPAQSPGNNNDDQQVQASSSNHSRRHSKVASGAHFYAFVDRDRLHREEVEGLPTIGSFTNNGFLPNDQIYRMWSPANWTDTRVFRYHDNGKVTVKRSGYYLIYAQMMFHGPAARKSYGIHVNDETMPLVESIAFETLHPPTTRRRRSLPSFAPGIPDDYNRAINREDRANDVSDDVLSASDASIDGDGRAKRSVDRYATYNQCNSQVVTYLNKNDQVFLKSLESGRTIIPERALTFFGLARL